MLVSLDNANQMQRMLSQQCWDEALLARWAPTLQRYSSSRVPKGLGQQGYGRALSGAPEWWLREDATGEGRGALEGRKNISRRGREALCDGGKAREWLGGGEAAGARQQRWVTRRESKGLWVGVK